MRTSFENVFRYYFVHDIRLQESYQDYIFLLFSEQFCSLQIELVSNPYKLLLIILHQLRIYFLYVMSHFEEKSDKVGKYFCVIHIVESLKYINFCIPLFILIN